jgi:hypothetical protein
MRPFITGYARPPKPNITSPIYDYDPERESAVSHDIPAIEDRTHTISLTASLVTMANTDSTRDEATDR